MDGCEEGTPLGCPDGSELGVPVGCADASTVTATLLVLAEGSTDTSDIVDEPTSAEADSISEASVPSSEAASIELLTDAAAALPSLDPPETASEYVLMV